MTLLDKKIILIIYIYILNLSKEKIIQWKCKVNKTESI